MSNDHPIHEFYHWNEPVKPEATQRCTECKKEKFLSEFGFLSTTVDHVTHPPTRRRQCYKCRREIAKYLKELRTTLVIPPLGTPCQNPECARTDLKLVLDHCHTTKEARGWLCSLCNNSIGQLGDTPESMQGPIVYFENAAAGLNIEYLKPNPMMGEFFEVDNS